MVKGPPLLVALDFADEKSCLNLVHQLNPQHCRLKIGKELFTSAGPAVVRAVQDLGFEVFLDLKFHDIPNTVAGAVKAAADLGVWMVNVHASGGKRMLEAAANALEVRQNRPLLIAVTVLTSMDEDDLKQIGIIEAPLQQVTRLASLAKDAGMDGVVSSAKEVTALKLCLGSHFLAVTPGIRPNSASLGDQRRVVTPEQAIAAGSDYIVIGRPITQADDPAAACAAIVSSIGGGD